MFQISKEEKTNLERMAYLNYLFLKDQGGERESEEYQKLQEALKEEYGEFLQLLINTGVFLVEVEAKTIESIETPWSRLTFSINNFYDNGGLVFTLENTWGMLVPKEDE